MPRYEVELIEGDPRSPRRNLESPLEEALNAVAPHCPQTEPQAWPDPGVVIDDTGLNCDDVLHKGHRERAQETGGEPHHGLMATEPPLADRPIPSAPILDEGRQHVGDVGRSHEIEEV